MAGGRGSRMKSQEEKLLLKYVYPTILHVVISLQNSNCFSKIFVATSPNSPKTKQLVHNMGIEIFETPGKGYVEDLNMILRSIDDDIFVISGDLPLIDAEIIKKIIKIHNPDKIWTSFLVTKDFLNSLGLKSDYSIKFQNKDCNFTGISIVKSKEIQDLALVKESFHLLDDKRIAFNLNTKEDYELLSSS